MGIVNALDLIKDDHDRLKKMFKAALDTTDATERSEMLQRIRAELIAHERMEEDIFYPALRASSDKAKDIVLEGYEEHHVIDMILDEMFEVPEHTDQWQAKLHENLEHHIEEEEGEMFSRAKKSLGTEALENLGQRMQQSRQAPTA
jgi:iron-sulfur cluster repair protein YtfE (RIC family)